MLLLKTRRTGGVWLDAAAGYEPTIQGGTQMALENTKTAENLRAALAGESIARNKYTYFAQAARDCGNIAVAEAFEQMAKN